MVGQWYHRYNTSYLLFIIILLTVVYCSCQLVPSRIPNYQSIDPDLEIYVISLKKDQARRRKLLPIIKKYPLKSIVFTAFSGWKLNIHALCANRVLKRTYNPRIMGRGHVGCFLSHLSVYQRITNHKLPWGLILEDDVVPGLDFKEKI